MNEMYPLAWVMAFVMIASLALCAFSITVLKESREGIYEVSTDTVAFVCTIIPILLVNIFVFYRLYLDEKERKERVQREYDKLMKIIAEHVRSN